MSKHFEFTSKNFLSTNKHMIIRHAFEYLYNASNPAIQVLAVNTDKVWLNLALSSRVFSGISCILITSKLNVGQRFKKFMGKTINY